MLIRDFDGLTPERQIIVDVLPMNEILCFVSWQFVDSNYGFYMHFSHLQEIMSPKTHIGPYLAFLTTETPGSWIIFVVLLMTELCAFFPGRFCIIIMVSMGISVIWRKFFLENTHRTVSTLLNHRNTWDMDHFSCSATE